MNWIHTLRYSWLFAITILIIRFKNTDFINKMCRFYKKGNKIVTSLTSKYQLKKQKKPFNSFTERPYYII
ncbi:hypothetical protein GCM10027049_15570 [Mucilaginibacter puniceus]